MLRILGSKRQACDRWTRREMLQVGSAPLLGIGLSDLFRNSNVSAAASAIESATFGKAKHCIVLFLYGAPSQLDTFDPKPGAPADIRGPFQTIGTKLPGVRISEHLPQIGGMLDRMTLVRSMSHPHPIHGVAYALTGIDKVDIPMELNRNDPRHWPYFGSVLEYLDEREHPNRPLPEVPNNVYLPWELSSRSHPHKRGGTHAGFLGASYNPVFFEFDGQATNPNTFRPNDPFGGIDPDCNFSIRKPGAEEVKITLDRLDRRRKLVDQFDDSRRRLNESSPGRAKDRFTEMAYSVIASPRVHEALDIQKEPGAIRERYGYHLFGQSALLARRLIEAGTRLVTVFWDEFGLSCGTWDTHEQATKRLRDELCPGLDQTLTALLDDLDDRGLLDETVVLCMGEHGRTPQPEKRNGLADGRGHWSRAYSALFAGCGIARGNVIGASDERAEWVKDRPASPKDILATTYHLLGVDSQQTITDRLNRPLPLVAEGEVVHELLASHNA